MKRLDTVYRRLSGRRRLIAYTVYGVTPALAYSVGYLLGFVLRHEVAVTADVGVLEL